MGQYHATQEMVLDSRQLSPWLNVMDCIIGGSSELPMWLTDCFLVTFFGKWRGAVHIHVSHVWLTCTVMPSHVAFNQWWRGASHIQLMCGSRAAHMWLTCTVMPSHVAYNQWWSGAPHIQLMCSSRVAHMHGNALTCSIQSMVEGKPLTYSSHVAHVQLTCGSHAAHMWLTCMVMPSHVAFNQWWRGASHVQLTCGSRAAHMWLTCMVMPLHVAFNQW